MITLFIFAIVFLSMFYIISFGSYVHYLQLCDYKNIKPLNYFEWLINGDDRV